jgi:hypothetical protein
LARSTFEKRQTPKGPEVARTVCWKGLSVRATRQRRRVPLMSIGLAELAKSSKKGGVERPPFRQ